MTTVMATAVTPNHTLPQAANTNVVQHTTTPTATAIAPPIYLTRAAVDPQDTNENPQVTQAMPTARTLYYGTNIPRYHEQQLSQKTRTIPRGESEKVPYIHCFRLNVLLIDDLGKILDDFHPDESGMYNDVKAPIPEPLTEMLDPATREAIVETGDESFISCATMLNNLVKAKLMNTNEYKAKSVRAMNRQYNAPGHIKDDPVIQSLTDEYDSLELDFHDKVRNIFRRSVQRTCYTYTLSPSLATRST